MAALAPGDGRGTPIAAALLADLAATPAVPRCLVMTRGALTLRDWLAGGGRDAGTGGAASASGSGARFTAGCVAACVAAVHDRGAVHRCASGISSLVLGGAGCWFQGLLAGRPKGLNLPGCKHCPLPLVTSPHPNIPLPLPQPAGAPALCLPFRHRPLAADRGQRGCARGRALHAGGRAALRRARGGG